MGYADGTVGQKVVIILNTLLRVAQLILGIATIAYYSKENGHWIDHDLPNRIHYELFVGALAIITAVLLGIFPVIWSYRPVAYAAVWDVIMFILYAAAFGLMRAVFYNLNQYLNKDGSVGNGPTYQPQVSTRPDYLILFMKMRKLLWLNLAGMSLFLLSAILSAPLLWIGRRNGRRAALV